MPTEAELHARYLQAREAHLNAECALRVADGQGATPEELKRLRHIADERMAERVAAFKAYYEAE